jgi:hypothetical protein
MDRQEDFNFSQRKAKPLRLTNELYLGEIGLSVRAIPAGRSRRTRKEPAPLVIEDSLDVDAGFCRKLPDAHLTPSEPRTWVGGQVLQQRPTSDVIGSSRVSARLKPDDAFA